MYNHTFTFKSLLVTLADSLQVEALLSCVTSQVIHPLNVLTPGGLGTGNNQLAHHASLGPAVVSVESDHHLVLLALFDVLALLGEVESRVVYLEGEGSLLVKYVTERNRSGGACFDGIRPLWLGSHTCSKEREDVLSSLGRADC